MNSPEAVHRTLLAGIQALQPLPSMTGIALTANDPTHYTVTFVLNSVSLLIYTIEQTPQEGRWTLNATSGSGTHAVEDWLSVQVLAHRFTQFLQNCLGTTLAQS